MSVSLGLDDVTEKARICGLAALLAERAVVRSTKGAILLAMMGNVLFNGRIGLWTILAASRSLGQCRQTLWELAGQLAGRENADIIVITNL